MNQRTKPCYISSLIVGQQGRKRPQICHKRGTLGEREREREKERKKESERGREKEREREFKVICKGTLF